MYPAVVREVKKKMEEERKKIQREIASRPPLRRSPRRY